MKIYLGSDHNGFHMRKRIYDYLTRAGYDVVDDGDEKFDPEDDFPVFAQRVVKDILGSDETEARGILLCGSGQGMCMAANRFKGIRAALGYDRESVRSSRNDDDSNILCLSGNFSDKNQVFVLVETWLNTPFANVPRFNRRIQEMDEMN